jgi:hypothetical protein
MADNLRGVEAIYRVIDALKTELLSNPFCNKVTMGTLTEVDLAKMTVFPLSHISLDTVTHNENTLSFSITLFNLDIVDVSKDLPADEIYGNDNLVYIWTNQLYVVNRLVARIKQSTIYNDGWELENIPSSDFINKEMENMLAGFQTTIVITVPNDISVC